METDGAATDHGTPLELPLWDAYRALNDQRIDIDRRMTALPPDDPGRDILWQGLEPVLANLRDVVGQLARTPATQIPELRAKAAVLATLLRSDDPDGGPVIPEPERSALALSLTDDIARLAGG
ncbi:MAG: hypothetical protein P4L90_21520 [Rhodopila sp.]|nr:hypothetical protein [Rhodopila sp.]